MMPDLTRCASTCGVSCEEMARVLLGAEAHDPLDAGAVVPAAVEDHDLAGGRQVREVALEVELRLLALGRRRQGDHPEDPRADPLGDALDHAALAGRVAALEDDHDPRPGRLHPGLQMRELDLEPGEFLEIGSVPLPSASWPAASAALSFFSFLLAPPRPTRKRRRKKEIRRALGRPACAPASKARSASSRSSKIIAGPIRAEHAGALEQRPRLGVQLGEAERDAAPGEFARTSSSIAAAVLSTCAMALASSTSQRVSGGSSSTMAPQSRLDVIDAEEEQAALDQADGEPRHRPRLGRSVQLVEAVAAGDAAEHARPAGYIILRST